MADAQDGHGEGHIQAGLAVGVLLAEHDGVVRVGKSSQQHKDCARHEHPALPLPAGDVSAVEYRSSNTARLPPSDFGYTLCRGFFDHAHTARTLRSAALMSRLGDLATEHPQDDALWTGVRASAEVRAGNALQPNHAQASTREACRTC
jgi:hypothetical protein